MFLGSFPHSLDGKGRIILPAKFRARLSEGCVITVGQDRCLYVFSSEDWQRKTEQLMNASTTDPVVRHFQEFLFGSAREEVPDRQGRVLIAEDLRLYAGLERDVTVVGAGPRAEIWDRASWERHFGQVQPEFAGRTEPIAGVGY